MTTTDNQAEPAVLTTPMRDQVEDADVQPVARVVSWTNGSYSRNYKLEWMQDVPEGTALYAAPAVQAVPAKDDTEKLKRDLANVRADFTALQRALVGDTGASAIETAHRLRAAQAVPSAVAGDANRAAVKTLEALGYSYHDAELWKPPLGKAPRFFSSPAAQAALCNDFPDAGEMVLMEAPAAALAPERCKCGYPMPCSVNVPIGFCKA